MYSKATLGCVVCLGCFGAGSTSSLVPLASQGGFAKGYRFILLLHAFLSVSQYAFIQQAREQAK